MSPDKLSTSLAISPADLTLLFPAPLRLELISKASHPANVLKRPFTSFCAPQLDLRGSDHRDGRPAPLAPSL
jgi:hypothetical protein